MESHFETFRKNIVGQDLFFDTPYGRKKMMYADWVASGRLYRAIENRMAEIAPFCANTHTETTLTGTIMTKAYFNAKQYIKEQVNASKEDMLVFCGSGMTGAICKLQRIMGLRIPERLEEYIPNVNAYDSIKERPVVFITHMEHHSNHTSWLETIVDLVIIEPNVDGLVCLENFDKLLEKYADRKLKIASVTACSNVTGITTPYHEIAKRIHKAGGYCWVDFACSGPYVEMNMHPEEEGAHLDVVFVSPHKFLGGPGTPGVVIFNKELYHNKIPDVPGGGTVYYTNPWNDHKYYDDIESREDGGTPPFLQGIRAAMAFKLKAEMGVDNILKREHTLVNRAMDGLDDIENLHVLDGKHRDRLGAISFYIEGVHFNLVVKLLNDKYGIQVRGGCACAGTYGHYLLSIDKHTSYEILRKIEDGHISERPGWIRLSLHPTMTDNELEYIIASIKEIAEKHAALAEDYNYFRDKNLFQHVNTAGVEFENQVLDNFYKVLNEAIPVN